MKRFLLFHGAAYYPDGGMYDFNGDFDSADEAIAAARAVEKQAIEDKSRVNGFWGHVYDTQERANVWVDENTKEYLRLYGNKD